MNLLFIVWGIFVFSLDNPFCVDGEFSPPPGGVTRSNFGVDFNFLYSLNNMHGSWKHIWTMDMALLERQMNLDVNLQCEAMDPMCDPARKFLEVLKLELEDDFKWMLGKFKWAHDPSILSTLNRQKLASNRVKRALLPFVGDIEKFFFGTATESDISTIKKTLDDMEELHGKTIQQVTNIGENLASLTKIVNSEIKNTKEGMNLIKTTFNNMTSQINARFHDIMGSLARESNIIKYNSLAVGHTWATLESILPQMMESVKLLLADTQLLDAIQVILQGYLPIGLISPEILQSGLDIALKGIQNEFPSATLTYDKSMLGYYYTHKIVTPYFEGEKISLIVDIPVELGQQLLYVYAIRTFPVTILPYNPYSRTIDPLSTYSVAQSELITKETHFLISSDGQSWSSARDNDMMSCTGETIRTCQHQFPMYKFSNTQCLERIWKNAQFSEILAVCPYQLSHAGSTTTNHNHVQVIPLSHGNWYIEAPLDEQWTITCPSRPPELRSSCTSCVIQVDCGCGVSSKYFTIPTRVSSCDNAFSPLRKNFSVNPFNYQPKTHPWVVNLTGDDTFTSPPKSIPDIRLPDGGAWDDVLEKMDSKQYDLNKLYEKQQNETKMFRTEADALLLKIKTQEKMLAALAGWPDWILGLMLFLTFGNTAVIGLMCCWFFTRARARPIAQELDLIEGLETEVLNLEIVHFILTLLCFVILVCIIWPVWVNWFHNSRMYRKFKGVSTRIKADGYRALRGHNKILLQGIFVFSGGDGGSQRCIPVQCILASAPIGTHLANTNQPWDPTVHIREDRYYLHFPKGLTTISPTEKEIKCEGLFFSYDYVHRKCKVPMASKWEAIRECHVWIE